MLHVISARYVERDLHTNAPGPLERTCWRQFTGQWGDCKQISNCAFECDYYDDDDDDDNDDDYFHHHYYYYYYYYENLNWSDLREDCDIVASLKKNLVIL